MRVCHIHFKSTWLRNLVIPGGKTRTMVQAGHLLWITSVCWIASWISGGKCWESNRLYCMQILRGEENESISRRVYDIPPYTHGHWKKLEINYW